VVAGDTLESIRDAFRRGVWRFTVHGLKEATADGIDADSLRDAIIDMDSEIVEDYPEHSRGACCLILGWAGGRAIHAVVSYPPNVVVITAYVPDDRWNDYRRRT
jgi:hypothetical protein